MMERLHLLTVHKQEDICTTIQRIVTGLNRDRNSLPNGCLPPHCRLGQPRNRLLVLQHPQQSRRSIFYSAIAAMNPRRQTDTSLAQRNIRNRQVGLPEFKQLFLLGIAGHRPLIKGREATFADLAPIQKELDLINATLVIATHHRPQIGADRGTDLTIFYNTLRINRSLEFESRHFRLILRNDSNHTFRGALALAAAIISNRSNTKVAPLQLLLNWQTQSVWRNKPTTHHGIIKPELDTSHRHIIFRLGDQHQNRSNRHSCFGGNSNSRRCVLGSNQQVSTNLRVTLQSRPDL
ncbi:hypothetical protein [Aquipseudomonas alcaligenes]|uniref:hypothetical protein n=1 Tax=Aquipseudomonas alcaligenes TaxID=43263 RepID=UPI0011156516|nr:hypothetical protein [Pseudomonas alcaligenes]